MCVIAHLIFAGLFVLECMFEDVLQEQCNLSNRFYRKRIPLFVHHWIHGFSL